MLSGAVHPYAWVYHLPKTPVVKTDTTIGANRFLIIPRTWIFKHNSQLSPSSSQSVITTYICVTPCPSYTTYLCLTPCVSCTAYLRLTSCLYCTTYLCVATGLSCRHNLPLRDTVFSRTTYLCLASCPSRTIYLCLTPCPSRTIYLCLTPCLSSTTCLHPTSCLSCTAYLCLTPCPSCTTYLCLAARLPRCVDGDTLVRPAVVGGRLHDDQRVLVPIDDHFMSRIRLHTVPVLLGKK